MQVANAKTQHGLSLIEMIISIVVITISLSSVFIVITAIYQSKSVILVQRQARAIAQFYLDQALVKSVEDLPCLSVKSINKRQCCEISMDETDEYLKNFQVNLDVQTLDNYVTPSTLLSISVKHQLINKLVFSAIKVSR